MATDLPTWPYSTHDEVSHLACDDVPLLQSRIDQLLEERRARRTEERRGSVELPAEWRLTATESRFLSTLLSAPGVVTKEALHVGLSDRDEPDTELKIVDVIVCKVRKKLTAAMPKGVTAVETVWGRGYQATAALRAQLALL